MSDLDPHAWHPPPGRDTGIVVRNSLTRTLNKLIVDPTRPITWYVRVSCELRTRM